MTRKEFKKSVWDNVLNVMRRHGLRLNDVVINHRLPTIAVNYANGCSLFFAQGQDASDMLGSYPDDINERVWTLYYLDSAGAI